LESVRRKGEKGMRRRSQLGREKKNCPGEPNDPERQVCEAGKKIANLKEGRQWATAGSKYDKRSWEGLGVLGEDYQES